MRRSASRLWASIISTAPPGKALRASPRSIPRSRAPASMAVSPQPSKGTWARAASNSFSCSSPAVFISVLRNRVGAVAALHLLQEHQLGEIGHAHGIEDAVEMIAFMLDHPGVEARGLAVDGLPRRGHAPIADRGMAGDPAGQAGDREAPLPAADLLRIGLP